MRKLADAQRMKTCWETALAKKGYTLQDARNYAHVSRTSWSNLDNGFMQYTVKQLDKMCAFTKVPVLDLLLEKGENDGGIAEIAEKLPFETIVYLLDAAETRLRSYDDRANANLHYRLRQRNEVEHDIRY